MSVRLGALHGVGQHQHRRLAGGRFRARIAISLLVDFLAVRVSLRTLLRPTEEVFDKRRAVVLADQVDDRLRQVVLPGEFHSLLHVGHDDQRAHRRHERLVAILLALILDEVGGFQHLADIVEVGTHADEQPAGA